MLTHKTFKLYGGVKGILLGVPIVGYRNYAWFAGSAHKFWWWNCYCPSCSNNKKENECAFIHCITMHLRTMYEMLYPKQSRGVNLPFHKLGIYWKNPGHRDLPIDTAFSLLLCWQITNLSTATYNFEMDMTMPVSEAFLLQRQLITFPARRA